MPKLTERTKRIRHRRFLKALDETGSPTKAALKVLHVKDEHVASSAGYQMLGRISEEEWNEFLPDDLLAKVHLEGLKAWRETFAGSKVPDFATRHKYLDSAYKKKGSYAPEKHVNVNFEAKTNPVVEELANKLNELLKQ